MLDTQILETGRLVQVLQRLDLGAEVRAAVDAAPDLDPERAIGTGLGLYISRRIIDGHGGRIWAES